MQLRDRMPADWAEVLASEFAKPYFQNLEEFVLREYESQKVYPPQAEIFSAFALCPYVRTRVVLLGQDPYHQARQAKDRKSVV